MSAGIISIDGSIVFAPSEEGGGGPTIPWPLSRQIAMSNVAVVPVTLASDAPVAVALNGITPSFLYIEATGKIDMTLTSADGTAQVISVDDFAMLSSTSVPYTVISLTRATGVATSVVLLLGAT